MGQTNDRPQKKKSGSAARFNDAKFVQYELTADERVACKNWLPNPFDLDELLVRFCEAGFSVSLKWDDYSKAYAAFAQTRNEKSENYGLILTGRGSTPLRAVKQALFKHFVVFDLQWAAYAETREAYDLDD